MSYTEPTEPAGPSPAEAAALERAEAAQRENLFLRAGVDVATHGADPKVAMLVDSLANTPTDQLTADAVRARSELLGLGQTTEPAAPEPTPLPGEEGQGDERGALSNAGPVEPDPMDVDPIQGARDAGFDALRNNATEEAAQATAFHMLAEAAYNRKDQRVLAHNHDAEAR